jgi:hypothetical protein
VAVLIVGAAALSVLVVAPLFLAVRGITTARQLPTDALTKPAAPWDWKFTIISALLYALAFNLTFLIQELFLVLPKAFTPGLRPTLFHNNHRWEGDNPLASLFQGTGALASIACGFVCVLLLKHRPSRFASLRLFLIWMVFNCFFMSLPQIAVGAVNPKNDLGMAMDYLQLRAPVKMAAAVLALLAIPVVALWLRGPILGLAESSERISDPRARSEFVFRVATLPCVAAILLIIPFRVPRDWIEVVMVPAIVTVIGISWIQAGAWAFNGAKIAGATSPKSTALPLSAYLILLFIFQCVLRPGIRFF